MIVVGHSLGGDNSVNIVRDLDKVDVDLLVTLDIADYWEDDNIPPNVDEAVNVYQDNDIVGGEDVEADDESKQRLKI